MYNSYVLYLCMKVKDFLLSEDCINLKAIANKIWPDNKAAEAYMYRKLSNDRPWTEKDEEKAKAALKALADRIEKTTSD